MSTSEKLQKALEAAIMAGYQLNSEAFEFLSLNSETADPVDLMNLALERLADMQEKPFFIEKVFLEPLVAQLTQIVAKQETTEPKQEKPSAADIPTLQSRKVPSEGLFYPFAKDKSNLSCARRRYSQAQL